MAIELHASYMNSLHDLDGIIARVARIVSSREPIVAWDSDREEYIRKVMPAVEFDTVVASGLSGTLVLPLLARHFKCHYLAVRKPKDGTHSTYPAEGVLGERWLFVDDFVSTGRTLARCYYTIESITNSREWHSECAGVASYQECSVDSFMSPDWVKKMVHRWKPLGGTGRMGRPVDVEYIQGSGPLVY